MEAREENAKEVRVLFYLSFKAASRSAWIWFVLWESGGSGPLSWVLSGKFLRTYWSLSKREDGQGGIAAAPDMEGHICGRVGKRMGRKREVRDHSLLDHSDAKHTNTWYFRHRCSSL